MACGMHFHGYDAKGVPTIAGTITLPDDLDWMPIQVKAEFYQFIGQGTPETKYVTLHSQGELLLLVDVKLNPINAAIYKEKMNAYEEHIDRFVAENGYARKPRGQ